MTNQKGYTIASSLTGYVFSDKTYATEKEAWAVVDKWDKANEANGIEILNRYTVVEVN